MRLILFLSGLAGLVLFAILSLREWAKRKIIPLPKITMIFLLGSSLLFLVFDFWSGLLGLVFSFFWFLLNLKKIPSDPPHKAILLLFGKRVPVVIDEGWHLALKPFSLYSFLPIKVEKINTDFEFDEIRTKAREEKDLRAGGRLSVQVSITYQPDYTSGDRLIEYLNSGGERGVDTILHDLIEEELRQAGADYDWEAFSFAQEEFTRKLLEKLTGEQMDRGQMTQLRRRGLPDVVDLGIVISRFTVGKIEEIGVLREAADLFEKERQQRRGEELEMAFVLERLQELVNQGLSPEEAIEAVQAQQGKIEKKVLSFRGLEKAAELLKNIKRE